MIVFSPPELLLHMLECPVPHKPVDPKHGGLEFLGIDCGELPVPVQAVKLCPDLLGQPLDPLHIYY